jgi:hypothetical protein
VLCKDKFGAGGPLEGLWGLVSMLDPLVNRGLEFGDVVEGSSSDALASDFGEELESMTSGSNRPVAQTLTQAGICIVERPPSLSSTASCSSGAATVGPLSPRKRYGYNEIGLIA